MAIPDPTHPFLGASPAIQRLEQEARKALLSDRPVLILGEAGAGKGSLARWLHRNGSRAAAPLAGLNCIGLQREVLEAELFGAGPGPANRAAKPGLFEAARGGTLFLDEIGDLDPAVQGGLLAVLEAGSFTRPGELEPRSVDVRLITATRQNLEAAMQRGAFRPDLYQRLGAILLQVPPLRKRVDDIPVLAEILLQALAREVGRPELFLSEEALLDMRNHRWAGNLRELRNVIERAVLRCPGAELRPEHIQPGVSSSEATPSYGTRLNLAEIEELHIRRVLEEEGGRMVEAARRLGIPYGTLAARLRTPEARGDR
jgi:DNA-binding NtrC family response regulator